MPPACCPAGASARRLALLPARLPAVLIPWETAVWDAWACARRDAAADDSPAPPVADAGKWAARVPDVLEPDASWHPRAFRWHLQQARPAARVLCIPDAARSGARSFAAAALPAVRARPERLVWQPWSEAGPEKQVAAVPERPALCC